MPFLQWLHHFIFLPAIHQGSYFSTPSSTLTTLLFDNNHPNGCEAALHCSRGIFLDRCCHALAKNSWRVLVDPNLPNLPTMAHKVWHDVSPTCLPPQSHSTQLLNGHLPSQLTHSSLSGPLPGALSP